MKISNISIENFRSIENCSLELTDFNVIVGQNNSGKTNLFEAIEWLYGGSSTSDDMRFKRDPSKKISVSIEFSGAQHGAENMLSDVSRTKILSVLNGSDKVKVTRRSDEPKKRFIEVNGAEIRNPTGFDTALNDFLPRFEYIHTRQYYEEFAKYTPKSAVGVMLSSVIEEILTDDPIYRAFRAKFFELFNADDSAVGSHFRNLGTSVRAHLEKQFSECSRVHFEVSTPEFSDLLKKFDTIVDDGIETYASDKGDGMQRALMLAIIQAYADYRKSREDAGKSFLFFIDEAELHLHPSAQRKLKTVLKELSASLDQVVISTHSSVFIADASPEESIHKCEKINGRTIVEQTDASDRPQLVFELLGGSPADLLLPRSFLIVEGGSELEFLQRVIKRLYKDKPPIQVVPANGDASQAKKSVNAIAQAYSPMERSIYADRTIVLCDKPTQEGQKAFDNFLKEHAALNEMKHIFVLPVGSLEESYPNTNGWKRTPEEVQRMSGREKKELAREVGAAIAQQEFESMEILFRALSLAWERAL